MNLTIHGIENSVIRWTYNGKDGLSTITPNGVVQGVLLCDQDFDLVVGVGYKILKKCQLWFEKQVNYRRGKQAEDRANRVQPFKIKVSGDDCPSRYYTVLATSELDARVLAFTLDGGLHSSIRTMGQGHIELAITYTEVVA